MKASNKIGILMFSTLAMSCAPQTFAPVDGFNSINDTTSASVASNYFRVTPGQAAFEQEVLDQNQTSTSFQVRLPDGTYKNDVKNEDLVITENGNAVPNFSLTSNSDTIVQTVDIVFAVDVTGSMTSSIESAKTRLVNFIHNTRNAGYHTRMCLITFGDFTVQHCNKFFDNDPKDPSTMAQVNELISEITKLKALKGAEDPGGTDLNENPMRALIDASNAPWASDSQRFLILMTDDGFLYSPGNSGAVGDIAPKYADVLSAIQKSQMKVFLAAPNLAGYNKTFQNQPNIVTASQGQFFLYSDLISGRITFDTILNQIISRIRTTYVAKYIADEVPALDPTLPMSQRQINVAMKSGISGTTVVLSKTSNLPDGRAQYKKQWKLSEKKIRSGSVRVRVNGVEIPLGFSVDVAGTLAFALPPLPGVKIEVVFAYEYLKDSLQLSPILLNKNELVENLSVLLNGKKAKAGDVIFSRAIDGTLSLSFADSVVSEADPFGIRINGGLQVEVLRAH